MAKVAPQPVDRWALRLHQLPPNPGAGTPPGSPPRRGGVSAMKTQGADWHPTIVSLMVLIVVEMAAFAALRYAFRTAHGG